MGSVRFVGDDESQPSATIKKKNKLPRKLLDDCGVVNHAPVPRRLRSAIKKRARESITPPLLISRKQLHMSNGVEMIRVDGAKKSRLNMKHGQITKDEEEVAETLYSLVDMFSDITKTNKPVLDGEPSEIKPSTKVEAGSSMTAAAKDAEISMQQEESGEINTRVTLESACHSSVLVNSTEEVLKYQSLDDAQQSELAFSEQSAIPIVSGIPSNSSLGPRPKMSTLDMIQSCEQTTAQKQVAISGIQYGNHHYPKEDKYKGLLLEPSLSSTGVVGSNTQGSGPLSLPDIFPAWFENTNCATQPIVNEHGITADKIHYCRVAVEPKKSRKRCSTHVYIANLVKVLGNPGRNTGSLQKPSQSTTTRGLEKGPHVSIDNQKLAINGRHGGLPFNGFIHSASEGSSDIGIAVCSHKRLLQDQQQPNKTSVLCSSWKRGPDFMSLDAGGSDSSGGVNRAGCSREALNQFNVSYQQPQNHSAMLFSLSQNGYSSTFHDHTSTAAAPKLPPYLSNTRGGTVAAPLGQQLESQQQKWTSQLQAQYSPSGVGRPHLLPDWQNGGGNSPSLLNYAQALFPHLHSVMGSKYQHFSPPQQQNSPINSTLTLSNVERHHHRLNSAYERNGTALCSENSSHMQLLCNQQL
ncbi:uncharacterized protein LOC105159342 isoform X2 [Sesamum indicum]|uniref:Uncharacterized protein LOC105159342 isoform X2 n=1 Tax=Sesamum indicum TaxID=4182 RepID=A0A8M8UWL2_SESIN|nr:uncharacterized protein LOC105159342 isoform X2 [Sesamum indicum]